MGLSEMRSSSSYRARICGQSVSSARWASSWTAAMAACSWYGPVGPLGQRVGDQRHPFPDGARSQSVPVLLGERDQAAVGPGACRAPRVG